MVDPSSGHRDGSRLRAQPRSGALPIEIERFVWEAGNQADGDPRLAIALLRDRLIYDPGSVAERAIFFDWLAGTETQNRVR
jgi:hypothetical protein